MATDQFHKDFESAKKQYPNLVYTPADLNHFKYKVTGSIPIIDAEGTHWGTFHASIYFKARYPYGFAVLQEVSALIPRLIDRHIGQNGECCVCGPLEALEMEQKPLSVLAFINNYAVPYFANQIHYEEYGYYVNGEYSHDHEGLWESFEELFNTKDRGEIIKKLDFIKSKPSVNKPCPCGSGRKIKRCHLNLIKSIRKKFLKN